MKRLLLISMLIGAMPLALMAQDDDLYFVPKKKAAKVIEDSTDKYGMPKDTYYPGSDRSVDDYNRRLKSSYEVIDGDTTKSDVINFSAERGVYPDSLESEDFALTKKMSRFEDYDISDNRAFWAGYEAGRSTWGWHSPWYYGRYGWYGGWYDPWYYDSWYGGWYDPWYYSYYGSWYGGWYSPWYWGYYGWGYPYHYYGYWNYPYYGIGGGGHYYGYTGNAGTINRNGSTHGYAGYRGSVAGSGSRMGSLRERASQMGGSRIYSSGNSQRSRSGNFSGRRGTTNSVYSPSNSSIGSSRSSGGSYGGGSFGGGAARSSGGGGGGHMGGRR